MNLVCWLLSVSLLCVLPSPAQIALSAQASPGQSDSLKRDLSILSGSTLESSDSEPFVLRVEYQLFDLEANPSVKGKAEVLWTRNEGELVSIESSTLTVGGKPLVDAYSAADRESFLVRQAMNAIVRPFPPNCSADPKWFSRVGADAAYAKTGVIYHFSHQDHIVMMIDHLSVAERSNFRSYDHHEVPSDIKLSYEGKTALIMHVTDLVPFSDSPGSQGYTASLLKPIPMRPQVYDAVLLPHKPVKYPFSADYQRVGGGVRLVAVVTMEGKIADLDVIASPQKALAKAAIDAVRTWTFEPHLEKGAPAEFEAAIDIDFNVRR